MSSEYRQPTINNERKVPSYALHKDGVIGGFFGAFSFLSNFYILENGVCLDEVYYPSIEHAYQAAKWPCHSRGQFLECTSAKAKALGSAAPKLDLKKWNKQKLDLMTSLCRQKFTNNFKLAKMLMMTDGCILEERNNWGDKFWGTDISGNGENHLGKILMKIREELTNTDSLV